MANGLDQLAAMPDWLATLDDDARVHQAIGEVLPGLRHVKLSGVRLKPGAWTARAVADVDGEVLALKATIVPPASRSAEIHVQPSRRPDGWPRWLPDLNLELSSEAAPAADLPAVALLTDPDRARELLENAIRAGASGYRDLRILAVTPQVMRHSPGSRCTVLYRLELPSEDAGRFPDVVVAKTYHRPDKGRIAWNGMRAIWESSLQGAGVVTVAEPLAWLPEPRILVQGPIPGERTLKDLLLHALSTLSTADLGEVRRYLDKTAAGLVALHDCGASSDESLIWEEELAEVRDVFARLVAVVPTLDGALDTFLSDLESQAARTSPDPAGPAHRSFRPAQVLLDHGNIGFIDFDGFCLAEPALDVALFRATVRDLGMAALTPAMPVEERLAILDDLCEGFLASYQALAPISRERVALWESLDLITNVLHSWTKAKPSRLERSMAVLRHHLGVREDGLASAPTGT